MLLRLCRLVGRWGVIVGCLGAHLFAAAGDPALQAKFNAANARLTANDARGALPLFDEILEADPKADNAWVGRARAKATLQDFSGARVDLAQALSLNPKNRSAYFFRASLRFQTKDPAGSLSDLDAIATLGSYIPEEWLLRARVLRAQGRLDAALADAGSAVSARPDFVAALLFRGDLQDAQGFYTRAVADYDRVLAIEPKHAGALLSRAWAKFYLADWMGAHTDAMWAESFQPGNTGAMRLMGESAFALGDYPTAAGRLAEAADLPRRDPVYPLIGRHYALLRLSQTDDRLATAARAATDPWVQALARFVLGEMNEDALEKLAAEAPDEAARRGRECEAHYYIGQARLQQGDKSTARLRFKAAMDMKQFTFVEHGLAYAELIRSGAVPPPKAAKTARSK